MSRTHIPSGSYRIGKRSDQIFEAFLGTCVGLTLCDRKNGVGGLIHLLLPEPPNPYSSWHMESYAATGIPLFMNTLCNAGAQKSNLVACIAGGALVGPISKRDLDLDIGGRTLEIAEKMLLGDNIPIQKNETGGYFTCCLSLNLNNWESTIEPAGIPAENPLNRVSRRPTITDLEETIKRVKPIPQIALKLIRMIRDDRHSLEAMAAEVRKDQIISAKVIRLCNSALFRSSMAADSIDRALVMMGEKSFLRLVISASFEDFFPENGNGYSLVKGGLFKHALGTAITSKSLAELSGTVSPDIAYTGGLLHDIGKVVLDQFVSSESPQFYRRTQQEGINLITVENDFFGMTHPIAGGLLAEKWSLPDSLIETIRHHHHPEAAAGHSELVHLVYLSDLLMSRFLVGQELERLNTGDLQSRLEKIGLTSKQFPAIIDSIPRQIFSEPFQPPAFEEKPTLS